MSNKRLKTYRMYTFNNGDIDGNSISKTDRELKLKEIQLSESILIKMYCKYRGLDFIEDMLITDIIKVMLSEGETKSRQQVKEIYFNGEVYTPWFSTPNMMKKEDPDTYSKCEMYFIKKEIQDFTGYFEKLISLGKLSRYKNQEVSINKDIIARIALATSSTFQTTIEPKIIILPECQHTVTSDIVTLIDGEVVEITEDTEDEALRKLRDVSITPFDGCGIMSMELASRIKKELELDHEVSFAGIRMYNGLAVKGVVVAVDFISYFEEFYQTDTPYFKKENGNFYTRDMFGDWQCVNDADLILNESQAKWAKHFKKDKCKGKKYGMELIHSRLQDLDTDKSRDYRDMLNALYIVKVNKSDVEINDYSLTNYQLLSNLAITEKEINQLSSETEKLYREILNGNEDMIRIFWGDIIRNLDVDDEGNIELEELDSISTKAQKLLTINPALINSAFVKRAVARMINKKLKLLAAGKFYIKGDYKTLVQCPITYMDWIMGGEGQHLIINSNGLKPHEFYCSNIEDEEIRTISRCPLNSFSEVLNIKFRQSQLLDKYLGHFSKEICIFNTYDLTPAILSGADFDLDQALVAHEEIIKNSVVLDLPLINLEDGQEPTKLKYTDENRIEAILRASGNLIGSLAMYGMGVCNLAQQASYRNYMCIDKNHECFGRVYSYQQLWEGFKDAKQDKHKENTYQEFTKELEERFEFVEDHYTEEALKQEIKKGFFQYRERSYELRNIQMKAIDAPKTLIIPEVPKYYKKIKKPRFLYYAKDYIKKGDTKNLDTALNLHATRIARELIKEDIEQRKHPDNLTLLNKYMICTDDAASNQEEYEKCKEAINVLYEKYKSEVNQSKYNLELKAIKQALREEKQKLEEEKNELRNKFPDEEEYKKQYAKLCKTHKSKLEDLMDDFKSKKEEIKKEYLPLKLMAESDCLMEADEIISHYDEKLISHSLMMLGCSENFIFKFFFSPSAKVIEGNSQNVPSYSYQEDINGDIQYLYRRYKKVSIHRSKDEIERLQDEGRVQLLKQLSKQREAGFTKEVAIGGCKLKEINFNKVILKLDSYMDRKTNEERKTIKVVNGDMEVGYIYPNYLTIGDFDSLFNHTDKEINFILVKRKHSRLEAILSYIA